MSKLIIAVDGLNLDIFNKVVEDSGFKYLSEFFTRTNRHSLHINLCSRGWPEIFCGKQAGSHRGFYFVVDPTSYNFKEDFSLNHYYNQSFWSSLNKKRIKQLIMAVPTTYPPPKNKWCFYSSRCSWHLSR